MAEGLFYHMTLTNLKIFHAWLSTSHFYKEYENRVVQELAVHFGWGDQSPSKEIADGLINLWTLWWIWACAVYDMVYVIKSLWKIASITLLITVRTIEVLFASPGVFFLDTRYIDLMEADCCKSIHYYRFVVLYWDYVIATRKQMLVKVILYPFYVYNHLSTVAHSQF